MSVCPSCQSSYEATVRVCPKDGTPLPIEPAPDANIGQLLEGKYRIDGFISTGGMGSVYRATHVMLDKTVAIKLIRKQFVQTAEAALRFQREARAASNLAHPNIAAVFDFGQTAAGALYIAMEYVEGPSLKEVIQRDGPMEPAKIVAILVPVASALARAHRHHIIHRDLKPHNIMLAIDRDGRQTPKLLDFGIAKTDDEPAGGLTMTGYALGTPQYMSPEQAMGKAVDGRSDLYSLGVVLYEMLIGEVPFADSSVAGVLLKQMTAAPDAPSRRRPDVPISPVLEAIALRCLDKDPDRRFQSAEDLGTALSQAGALETATVVVPTRRTSAAAVAPVGPGDPGGENPAGTVSTLPLIPDKAATGAAVVAVHVEAPASLAAPAPGSAQQAPKTMVPPAHDGPGETADRLRHEPAPPQAATTPAASSERSARTVKPGTQPTVVVPAVSPDLTSTPPAKSATPGPTFWIAAAVIVLAVLVSGAWVIRSWTPPFSASNDEAPAPTATPAMAQPAASADTAQETPSPGAASPTNDQEVTSPATDSNLGPPGRAPSEVTATVEAPPVSPVVSPAGRPTPMSAPSGSLSRPGPAPAAGSSFTGSSAGASRAQSRPPASSPSTDTAAVPNTGPAPPSAPPEPPVAPARAENPTVFIDCNGPQEICSPVRSAIADALGKDHMQLVSGRSRADVTLAVEVEVVEQRVQQSFGTTFAPRTYSVDVSGESHGLVVSMKPGRTFSFDAQVGRQRANENARLIASDAVDSVRAFWNKRP